MKAGEDWHENTTVETKKPLLREMHGGIWKEDT